jgi:hypothetical protein
MNEAKEMKCYHKNCPWIPEGYLREYLECEDYHVCEHFAPEAEPQAASPVESQSPGSVPRASSDTLIEIHMELTDPAKWAAHQISTKSYGIKTVGEAMDMIEAIVNEAISMAQNRGIGGK